MDQPAEPRNPVADVLNTTELLEKILLGVSSDVASLNFSLYDMKTVHNSQRVNRQFRNVIRGSPSIRQKLWLDPGERYGQTPVLNPLIHDAMNRRKIPHLTMLNYISNGQPAPIAAIGVSRVSLDLSPPVGSWMHMILLQPHPKSHNLFTLKWEIYGYAAPDIEWKRRWELIPRNAPTAGQLFNRLRNNTRIPGTIFERDVVNKHVYFEDTGERKESKVRPMPEEVPIEEPRS